MTAFLVFLAGAREPFAIWLVPGDGGGGGGTRFVTRAKKARSLFSGGHGREPARPMPREGVVATMRVRGGKNGGIDGGAGCDDVMTGW